MQQIINIGDGQVPVVVTYYEDETGPFVIEDVRVLGQPCSIVGVFTWEQLDDISDKLVPGHAAAMKEEEDEMAIFRSLL
jgi:major membrane immunogen (membrane-anchored lipoprotein)